MQTKIFSKILDIVILISIIGILGTLAYTQLPGVSITLKVFALGWTFLYLFCVTLGFRGSIESHKENMRRFAVEWIVACLVGAILAFVVIMFY